MVQDSLLARQRRLHDYLTKGAIGPEVIDDLLSDGEPFEFEDALWDYKLDLPDFSNKVSGDPSLGRLLKTALAFHNSFGGYILAGVRDAPRRVVGFAANFNCDLFNEILAKYTRSQINCAFKIHEYHTGRDSPRLGLLYVPPRSPDTPPVEFRKSYKSVDGQELFRAGQIYIRQSHSSVPASTSDDFRFLMTPQRLQILRAGPFQRESVLDNNLPPRDPEFIEFVGRHDELDDLWRWLSDRYNPVKILTGMGGVGKTTIARVFAEQIVEEPPIGLEKVVWLSAKKSFFVPTLGRSRPAIKVDFVGVRSMLIALLNELGRLPGEFDEESDVEELVDDGIAALELFPSLLIVDDVDSLAADEQYEIFHMLLAIMAKLGAHNLSRALLTSRLDLGAGAARLVRVKGLPLKQFYQYIRLMSDKLDISLGLERESPLMRRFHKVTDGSPMFGLSVLRLVNLGDRLDAALSRWKDADGQDVRRFAFERELDSLTESQLRTLYAVTLLRDTSLVELQHVTKSPDTRLRDDVAELRKYHLLSFDAELAGGARLVSPEGIGLMAGVIQSKITDPRRIERSCEQARKSLPATQAQVGQFIHRVVALWGEDRADDALQVAKFASERIPKSGDLRCLLGRAYLRLTPPDPKQAELAFREAYRLGCKRSELISLWLEARLLLNDWVGVTELTRLAEKVEGHKSEYVLLRSEANLAVAEMESEAGNLASSANILLEIGMDIDRAFASGYARGHVHELRELRSSCLHRYVRILDRLHDGARDGLWVWVGCVAAFRAYVRSDFIIRLGTDRLNRWWDAVSRDERFDQRAFEAARRAVDELDEMLDVIHDQETPNEELAQRMRMLKSRLDHEKEDYLNGTLLYQRLP